MNDEAAEARSFGLQPSHSLRNEARSGPQFASPKQPATSDETRRELDHAQAEALVGQRGYARNPSVKKWIYLITVYGSHCEQSCAAPSVLILGQANERRCGTDIAAELCNASQRA